MTGWVKLPRSMPVSRHIASLCSEAADSTYIRDVDIKTWATRPGSEYHLLIYFILHVTCYYTQTDHHNSMSSLHYRNVNFETREEKKLLTYLWQICIFSTEIGGKWIKPNIDVLVCALNVGNPYNSGRLQISFREANKTWIY